MASLGCERQRSPSLKINLARAHPTREEDLQKANNPRVLLSLLIGAEEKDAYI